MDSLKVIVCFFMISFSSILSAQETAIDFNVTDCYGNNFHLFEVLDAGKAVVLEFAMLPNCPSCLEAATGLQSMYESYQEDSPGMLKWFTVGFSDSYDCNDVFSFDEDNGFTPTGGWVDQDDMVSYYGGMGMPTIVVLGGANHQVLFNHQGFTTQLMHSIDDAVQDALALSVQSKKNQADIAIYPNPCNTTLNLTCPGLTNDAVSISLIDLQGKTVVNRNVTIRNGQLVLDVTCLPNGMYCLNMLSEDSRLTQNILIQR